MSILDQNLDLNGQEKHRLYTLYGPPNFVKEASTEDVHGDDGLTPLDYADPLRKLYPCHTEAATWTSAAFFFDKRAELAPIRAATIEDQLNKAAEVFGIADKVQDLRTKIAGDSADNINKLSNDYFACVLENNGKVERSYPLRNAVETKQAADYFLEYRDSMPWYMRNQFAMKVLKKAEDYGAAISGHREELEKSAGQGLCSASDVIKAIRQRAKAAALREDVQEMSAGLEKLASAIEANTASILHRQNSIVELLDDVDRKCDWQHRYQSDWDRPEEVVFGVTEKTASELASKLIGNKLTGNYYQASDLERLPAEKIAEVMGDDMVEAVTAGGVFIDTKKMAAVVPTLPLGDAEMFDQLAAVCGVSPFATQASQ